MASILIHVTTGPDNPTKAALSFLVAKTALAEGHTVDLFLAEEAVSQNGSIIHWCGNATNGLFAKWNCGWLYNERSG